LLAGVCDLPEDGYCHQPNHFGEIIFSLLKIEERIEYYLHIILFKGEIEGNENLNVYCERVSLKS